ncbi:MAG: hypothetical protein ACK4NV_11030 [Pannonibacter sp.]
MDYNEIIIRQLEVEWDLDGFFHRLRAGDFDAARSLTVLEMLRSIKTDETQLLPRRLVSLLWYLPSFLDWQTERVAERNGDMDAYRHFCVQAFNALEDILGTP